MNNQLELQTQLDPTSPAQANVQINFPVAIKRDCYETVLLLSNHKQVSLFEVIPSVSVFAYENYLEGKGQQIPITDFISELEAIIAEVKKIHGLDAKVLEWDFADPRDNPLIGEDDSWIHDIEQGSR